MGNACEESTEHQGAEEEVKTAIQVEWFRQEQEHNKECVNKWEIQVLSEGISKAC